jgi:methyl-accepting chemotaxis protein
MLSFFSARSGKPHEEDLAAVLDRAQRVIEFAPDGTIVRANANCLALIGYTLAEIAGKPAVLLGPDFDVRPFRDALRRGECPVLQHKWQSKQGEDIWVEASFAPVRDSEGALVKAVALVRDITA